MKIVGQISGDVIASLPEGHYTVDSFAKELTYNVETKLSVARLVLEKNKPNSILDIRNWEPKTKILVSRGLASLIGSSDILAEITYIKKLNCPSTYFIHCNLMDKTENLFNTKKSDVLVKFDMKGLPYEKVSY